MDEGRKDKEITGGIEVGYGIKRVFSPLLSPDSLE